MRASYWLLELCCLFGLRRIDLLDILKAFFDDNTIVFFIICLYLLFVAYKNY